MKTKPFKFGPVQKRWLHMLETTRRKQGRGSLRTTNGGYCCLGIGELALGKKPSEIEGKMLDRESFRALGLRSGLGEADDITYSCGQLNDNARMTFKRIAAHLRANGPSLFHEVEMKLFLTESLALLSLLTAIAALWVLL
jgi:hypothetical protein